MQLNCQILQLSKPTFMQGRCWLEGNMYQDFDLNIFFLILAIQFKGVTATGR